jgi:prephenate dehydratase
MDDAPAAHRFAADHHATGGHVPDRTGRVAFLGPEGTFTEEALLAAPPGDDLTPFPYGSIADVMQAVQSGEADLGIVPIENSLEGSVTLTLDLLAWGYEDLHIVRETTHPIRHQLIARRDLRLDEITKVVSIPIAYGQCRNFIREHLAGVEHEATDSTAEAVRRVSRVDRPWVAIGTALAAQMYECVVIRDDVEDSTDNRTRFVYVSRWPASQDLDAHYKTSIVCGIANDQPGSLLLILSEFAYRFVNLTKIESRPSRQGLGDYIFFIDMEGKGTDQPIQQALSCLGCKLPWVRMLGSYPT